MQRPAPDFPADARQRLWAGGGLEVVREDAAIRLNSGRTMIFYYYAVRAVQRARR